MRASFAYLFLFHSLLLCHQATAQMDVQLQSHWDYKRIPSIHQKINKIIAISNGYIVAVGETLSPNKKNLDGFFLVLNEGGEEVRRKSFGRDGDDSFTAVAQNPDGTFTIVGYTYSDKKRGKDGWIIQVDLEGNELFEIKPYSKEGRDDELRDIAVNSSGEILAIGSQMTKHFSGLWLININNGELAEKVIEKPEYGFVKALSVNADGHFVVVGNTYDFNKQHPNDAWLLKINKDGQDLWGGPKYFGDAGYQEALGITATNDGGYAIAGINHSKSAGKSDKWLLKVNEKGESEWDETYGGAEEDEATSVIELSEGGYALFGQTKSYMVRAPVRNLELTVVDEKGKELDSGTCPFIGAGKGEQIGHSLVELFTDDIIIAGNSTSKSNTTIPYIGAYIYKGIKRTPNSVKPQEDNFRNTLALSQVSLLDGNSNGYLELGERGALMVEVRNQSNVTLHNVTGHLSADEEKTGIDFWKEIKLGILRPGQTKHLYLPLHAQKNLEKGEYGFSILLNVKGKFAARTTARIKTNRPKPPQLVIYNHHFFPEADPRPGEEVLLKIELSNTGGAPTGPLEGDFSLPANVISNGSERHTIPSIQAGETRSVSFSFSYNPEFKGKNITVVFEANGLGLSPFRKSFHLGVTNQAVTSIQSPGPMPGSTSDEMVWVSPDPMEFQSRTVDVTEKDINIRIMALSDKELKRENFGTIINGQLIGGEKMDEVTLRGPSKDMGRNRYTYKDKIRLIPGKNTVQIIYRDESGFEFRSLPLVFDYIPKGNPSLHVLSIGVEHDDLKYTVQDAKDIAGEFWKLRDERGRGFKKVDVKQLIEKEHTTTINIRKAFVDLNRKNIKDNDLVVVFISSHGKVSGRGNYILIPSDFDPGYEEMTSIDFKKDILDQLRGMDGKILVFIDACHSGSAIAGGKSFSDEAASKFMNDLIQKTSGLEIIASCSDQEYSYEDDRWQNGAFTEAILEAFNNTQVNIEGRMIQADIFDEMEGKKHGSDGIITIEELRRFIEQRVPHLVKSTKHQKQNPSHKSTELLPKDTPIFMVISNN